MTRNELIQKIITAEEQLSKAGKIHRRDLLKHIKRMQRELRDYDRFHVEAARG
jgi:hypothetical protein